MHLQRPANTLLACYVARTTVGGRNRPVAQARHDAGTDSIRPHISNCEVFSRQQDSTPMTRSQEMSGCCQDGGLAASRIFLSAKHSPRPWTSQENAAQEVVPACGLPLALTMSTAIARQTDTGEIDDVTRDECAAVDAGDQESADHWEEAAGIVPTQRDQPAPQESRAALPQRADNQHPEVESGATHPSESGLRGWFTRWLARV
jgi:hypothetical protein